jgi:glycosyltransferase involved in cell wall biosynthesis
VKPILVVHVITKLDVGGAQTIVRELVSAQAEMPGRQVIVVTGTVGPIAHDLEAAGIEVLKLPILQRTTSPLMHMRAVKALLEALISLREHHSPSDIIVHAHSSNAGLVARTAGRKLNIPVVYTAHGWPFQPGAPLTQRFISFATELIARRHRAHVVCVSVADFQRTLRGQICPLNRLHLVANGIGELPSQASRSVDAATCNVVMVARFAVPKRQDLLLEAVRLCSPTTTATFVGDGPLWEGLKRQVLPSDAHRIRFVGATNPEPFLQDADVFALISDYEGFSVSILEAMRAGLPIVANDLPGLTGAIEDGVTGLVVASDPRSIAEAIDALANDTDLRERIGLTAQRRWAELFTRQQMANGYERVYRIALGR